MRTLITIILILGIAGVAAAERTVTTTPLAAEVQHAGSTPLIAVCTLGNDATAAYAITDYIWGAESYATVFSAPPLSCDCAAGFTVDAVHFYMNFRAEDVPAAFDVAVSFHETYVDPTSGCSVPGQVICTSPTYTVNITASGLYDISLPMGPCACAYFGYDYAVSISFPAAFPSTMRPDAVTDDTPTGCTSWNDFGSGWQDTYNAGFPGELVMYADVVCCNDPVADESTTWGSLKSLYR